jgi:radical SAM protein with 4Fe4S-binding SPASM domain
MKDSTKYPVFNQKIYKNPKGGIILPKSRWKEKYNVYKVNVPPQDQSASPFWGNLNEFGTRLLLDCNGEKSIEDIVDQIYKEKKDEFRDSIYTFFKDISLKFDIDFFDEPSPHTVESCGTFECYYPLRVLVEVTKRCNLKCQHCSASAGKEGEDIKKEDLFRLIDQFSEKGTWSFEISGGEPFLRKDICDIVKKCSETFHMVVLATNGTLIKKEEAQKLAEFGNICVQVSLDSHTSQFHDKFRGLNGAFDKAINAIYNLVSQGIYTRIEITVTEDNVKDFEKIVLLANELGIGGINYDMTRTIGRGTYLSLEPEDIMAWMEEVEKVNERYKDRFSLFYARNRREFTSEDCGAGRTFWTLGPTGNIRPCNYLSEDYLVCGNLLREDFHTVFNRDPATRFSTLKFPCKEICGDCTYLPHCNKCFCNGVLMYKKLKENCVWGVTTHIEDWVNVKGPL